MLDEWTGCTLNFLSLSSVWGRGHLPCAVTEITKRGTYVLRMGWTVFKTPFWASNGKQILWAVRRNSNGEHLWPYSWIKRNLKLKPFLPGNIILCPHIIIYPGHVHIRNIYFGTSMFFINPLHFLTLQPHGRYINQKR